MKTARILVIDDDDHVREALVDELSGTYRVESVGSGSAAFTALAQQQYDVVISDLKMPDHDGIEVLEFARVHQRDAVRVLLTGYLDDHAQRALMSPDAPYKVGKPWHDEIEVVVRRGLEQRELARQLFASVEDALNLASLDTELGATRTSRELSEAIVRRALTVEGVTACAAVMCDLTAERVIAGGTVLKVGVGWYVDLPLDADGELRLRARGVTDSARTLIQYMSHRAQRVHGVLEARVSTLDISRDGDVRLNKLMRQATLGALASSLLHDLASTVQALTCALDDVRELAPQGAPELGIALAQANAAGEEAVQLFVQMRKFIREGEVRVQPVRVDRLVDRVLKIAGGYVRERADLRIGELPDVEIMVSGSLFLQVLANLLRNAANASPASGVIDMRAHATDTEVVFTVVDDGAGVAPEIADSMFEPFASTRVEGTGLGLAISAYVMEMLGGRISYRRDPVRGASFSVAVARAPAAS
jgi:C4-dicarboxylate-specific signal transduction histidine kinase